MKTLSIDIGGTTIKSAVIDNGQLFDKKSFPTSKNLAELAELLQTLIKNYQNNESFEKVALAVPGAVLETGIVKFGGAVTYLNQVDLISLVQSFFPGKVVVENDAKAATLGEMKRGNLQGVENAAALILGTGVGLGIVINGKLYKGEHRQAGEISFLVRDRQIVGIDSFVGSGLSAVALIAKLAKVLEVPKDGKLVFDELKKNTNPEAEEILNAYCQEIALLCFNLQTILDLEKIVIGGGISQQKSLIDKIQMNYKQLFLVSPLIEQTLSKISIEAAKFKADANLFGAAEVK
ncbi:sugar kinase [Enterococcus saigonensis]|uniref:Sugar kinase n=1 Tax=Enterococcus saigonensis TaxID=1805431 RepID=A0A679IMC2_9ENTE|nr:ROK family protein [Enterococcus saigonensis]BCA85891.1 sugar kinase [Enterococcus saigonensis]